MSFATFKDAMLSGETLVFGHRGAKDYAPMNTIPAFELALEQGAAGIELDVHRSKDGHPVIVHDFTVDATTDGDGNVVEKTLDELKRLDAGSWFSDEFTGLKIPTLDEVFEAVGDSLLINVEIKSMDTETDGVEQVVADCITRHNMRDRVLVSSFNPMTLKRFRPLLPHVMIGFLYMAGMQMDTESMIEGFAHEARHPYVDMIDEQYMTWANDNNYFVNTWTVNDPERAKELKSLGVNCVITDAPDLILKAIQ